MACLPPHLPVAPKPHFSPLSRPRHLVLCATCSGLQTLPHLSDHWACRFTFPPTPGGTHCWPLLGLSNSETGSRGPYNPSACRPPRLEILPEHLGHVTSWPMGNQQSDRCFLKEPRPAGGQGMTSSNCQPRPSWPNHHPPKRVVKNNKMYLFRING